MLKEIFWTEKKWWKKESCNTRKKEE
jgi:hypothetical protein